MRDGVIIDCGRQEGGAHPKEDDDWWLDLYVMLSRATQLDDVVLMRAPDFVFFRKGASENIADTAGKTCGAKERMQKSSREYNTGAWSGSITSYRVTSKRS